PPSIPAFAVAPLPAGPHGHGRSAPPSPPAPCTAPHSFALPGTADSTHTAPPLFSPWPQRILRCFRFQSSRSFLPGSLQLPILAILAILAIDPSPPPPPQLGFQTA